MCDNHQLVHKKVQELEILGIKRHLEDIVEIVLKNTEETQTIKPCQFFNLGIKTQTGPILKRPISVSHVSEEGIHFVIRELGEGTRRLTRLSIGDRVLAVGPLGNGVVPENYNHLDRIVLMGGGIGTAPLLELAKEAKSKGIRVTTILGYQKESYLEDVFAQYSDEVYLCSLEKSEKVPSKLNIHIVQGTVIDGLKKWQSSLVDRDSKMGFFSCGPDKMLEAIQKETSKEYADNYLITEERMACGMGACLVCAKKVEQDGQEKMLRTCVEGPVFRTSEVIFND